MIKVNNDCIGCGICGITAPTVFKVEGIATVIKQPTTSEEHTLCEEAIISCPVNAISNEDSAKMAA